MTNQDLKDQTDQTEGDMNAEEMTGEMIVEEEVETIEVAEGIADTEEITGEEQMIGEVMIEEEIGAAEAVSTEGIILQVGTPEAPGHPGMMMVPKKDQH